MALTAPTIINCDNFTISDAVVFVAVFIDPFFEFYNEFPVNHSFSFASVWCQIRIFLFLNIPQLVCFTEKKFYRLWASKSHFNRPFGPLFTWSFVFWNNSPTRRAAINIRVSFNRTKNNVGYLWRVLCTTKFQVLFFYTIDDKVVTSFIYFNSWPENFLNGRYKILPTFYILLDDVAPRSHLRLHWILDRCYNRLTSFFCMYF